MKNLDTFVNQYSADLLDAVQNHRAEYSFDTAAVPEVVVKMRVAFERGSFNKDSRAVKATCKHFKIKHTYQAIKQFLEGL